MFLLSLKSCTGCLLDPKKTVILFLSCDTSCNLSVCQLKIDIVKKLKRCCYFFLYKNNNSFKYISLNKHSFKEKSKRIFSVSMFEVWFNITYIYDNYASIYHSNDKKVQGIGFMIKNHVLNSKFNLDSFKGSWAAKLYWS